MNHFVFITLSLLLFVYFSVYQGTPNYLHTIQRFFSSVMALRDGNLNRSRSNHGALNSAFFYNGSKK